MTHRFADVRGTQIHYEEQGEGRAVILLHAGINDLRMWDEQVGPLSDRHRVVRYDMRGRGQTPDPSGPFSDHDDLLGLLNHLHIERAALVGSSGGGKVALDFALVHPEMVDRLVLAGPGLGGYEWTRAGFADKAEAMRVAYRRGDEERAAELWTQVWVDGPSRPATRVDRAVRSRAHDMLLDSMRRFPGGGGERQEINPPAIERLGDVAAPTLVIVGEHDVPDIHAISELLVSRIPDARLVEMDDVGHLLAMEKPAEFNRLLLGFL